MRWASAIATPSHLGDALAEAAESVLSALDDQQPDLVVAFVSGDHSDHFGRFSGYLREHFPDAEVIGCSAGGVIGGGREIEGEPALSLTGAVLPDVELKSFHLDADPDRWELPDLGEAPEFILLPDPHSVSALELVEFFDEKFPDAIKIGGLASGAPEVGGHALFTSDGVHRSGAVGLALSGNLEIDTIVAQGCRPIGQPMFVTRSENNVILELDSQPALTALEILHAELSPDDQQLFRTGLLVGVVMEDSCEVYEHGDFLIRNIRGIDPKLGAIAVDLLPSSGKVVQFHLRDAATSAEDLSEMLSRHQYAEPAGALLFSCMGRGRGLYGEPNHDSAMFAERLGPVPLGGFFGNGEIGPVQGKTYVHGYTSSFGLFRPKRR